MPRDEYEARQMNVLDKLDGGMNAHNEMLWQLFIFVCQDHGLYIVYTGPIDRIYLGTLLPEMKCGYRPNSFTFH